MNSEKKIKILAILSSVLGLFLVFSSIAVVVLAIQANKDETATKIFDDTKNSVVELKSEKEGVNPVFGSAVFVDKNGTLASNAHLVTYQSNGQYERYDSFSIRFCGDEDYYQVSLTFFDISKDLSLLKLKNQEDSNLYYNPVLMRNSSTISAGERVYAVGNAMNHGISISQGIVSIPLINVVVEDKSFLVIQCDLTISNGNSGGALLDSSGKLLGITAFRLKDSSGYVVYGVAFCIPTNQITAFIAANI